MTYVAINVNLTGLTPEEETEIRANAADLDLDVLRLFPKAGPDPETIILTAALSTVVGEIIKMGTSTAFRKLGKIIEILKSRNQPPADAGRLLVMVDEDSGLEFIVDDELLRDLPRAAAAMDAVLRDAAIPDRTMFAWSRHEGRWLPVQPSS